MPTLTEALSTLPSQQSSSPAISDTKTVSQEETKPTASASTAPETTETEAPKAEATPKEPEAVKPEDKLGSKFAALTRKERQVVAKQQELKAIETKFSEEKSKFEAERASYQKQRELDRQELETYKSLKSLNPIKAMETLGYTYQQLTEAYLNDSKPTAEQQLQQFKEELAAKEKEREENAKKEQESLKSKQEKDAEAQKLRLEEDRKAAETELLSEIGDFVKSHSDEYELTNLYNQVGLIYSVMDEHYKATQKSHPKGIGSVLSLKDASDMVEKHLESELDKTLATKKYKAKVSPPAPQQAPKQDTEAKSQINSAPTRTLNNTMTPSVVSSLPAKTEADRMKRALAALDQAAG